MASASSARLKGDDYQHLFAWLQVLELLMPQRFVSRVIVEDSNAGSADDVTQLRDQSSHLPDRYHQVKYHVDHSRGYSIALLTEHKQNQSSLIKKWYRSWETLITANPTRPLIIDIISNWGWDGAGGLGEFIDSQENKFKEEFFAATGKTKAATIRSMFAKHLGSDVARFDEFAKALRFHLGYECWHVMAERVAERMEHYGLKSDENALLVAVGIVRGWVTSGRQEITKADLEDILQHHNLRLPLEAKPSVNVYLTTIKEQKFDVDPDYLLDWRSLFLGAPNLRGHDLIEPSDWNGKMLPQLRALENRVSAETNKRLVRARGMARLSAWFAFGNTFGEVAGYTIEVEQQGQFWQTDALPSDDFKLQSNGPDGYFLDPDGETVVVAISITSDIDQDVRRHLEHRKHGVKSVLFVRPERDLGRHCLRNGSDAVALADAAKNLMRRFVKHHGVRRLEIYFSGPLGAACFIGHRLNAVCREIQIMEWSDPEYVESFTLTY